jgi:hypothetical protein
MNALIRFIDSLGRDIVLLKSLGVLLTLVFLGLAVILAIRAGWIERELDLAKDVLHSKKLIKKRTLKAWTQIKRHLASDSEASLKLALIEADSLLDKALAAAGYRGTNMGERLKQVRRAELSNIEEIWTAHKLRNDIAHEHETPMTRPIAERAIGIYAKAFKELGLLEEEE